MSKREIAIKATHMCLSFLSLMGSSKTKAELLNCATEARGSWSHVQEQFRVVAPALAHEKCPGWAMLWSYLFVFDVTVIQGKCWVWFWGPNKLHSLGQGSITSTAWTCGSRLLLPSQFSGEAQFSRGWEKTPTSPFNQASKPEQDRSSELLRQLSGVIS